MAVPPAPLPTATFTPLLPNEIRTIAAEVEVAALEGAATQSLSRSSATSSLS